MTDQELSYKIKGEDRRSYPLNKWELEDGTYVSIYQGFRGQRPELDFIVKYKEPSKRLRTPSHTHWIVDLLIKGECNKSLTKEFVEDLIKIYDSSVRFTTVESRDNYQLRYYDELKTKYMELNNHGQMSVQMIISLVELFSMCEKQTDGAFMFKGMIELMKQYLEGKKDYYQVVGISKRV